MTPGGGAANPGGGGAAVCDPNASLASARVWRLTDEEYVNVVSRVFGVTMPAEITEPAVPGADFANTSEQRSKVDEKIATLYQTAAHLAGISAVGAHLKTFLPCGSQSPTDACVEGFIRSRVARAFSRPVSDTEVQSLLALYKTGATGTDGAATGIRLVIEATLQAPSFLYRTELGNSPEGGPTAKVNLTPYEVASAISFGLTDTIPDDALWNTAEDGSISQPAVLAAQVDRLLALPDTQKNLSHLAGYWLGAEKILGVTKVSTVYTDWTPQVQTDLYNSTQMFVQDVVTNGTVSDLLTSNKLYMNASLAKIYNVSGVTGTALQLVTSNAPERSMGILSQPGIMAATGHPHETDVVHRGLYIYNSFVCGASLGSPPPGALEANDALPASTTQRERAVFRQNPACKVCHSNFDPMGLATERYDGIGRYSEKDSTGAPINASSTVGPGQGALAGPITGLPDLVAKLKVGRLVSDCATVNLTPLVIGRQVREDKSCAVSTIKDKFAATGSFKDYYRALLTSPAFLTRDPQAK